MKTERERIKSEKREYKKAKKNNFIKFNELRKQIMKQVFDSETPNWGGLKLSFNK